MNDSFRSKVDNLRHNFTYLTNIFSVTLMSNEQYCYIVNIEKTYFYNTPLITLVYDNHPTVKRILPDWSCLPNKLGGDGRPPPPPPPPPVRPCPKMADICHRKKG